MTYKLVDAAANRILDLYLGSSHDTTLTPATLYVALFTGTETSNAGAGLTEVSGSAYARVAVVNNSTNFPNASARSKSNGVAITFPQPTGSWGTVTTVGIYDAATVGNLIDTGLLTTPRSPDATTDPPSFAVGALVFTVPS